MMKSIFKIALLICFVIVIADPVAAIDRTKKPNPPPKDKTAVKEKQPEKPPEKQPEKKTDKSRSKKNYDSFIDKNNNGIDDRAEKKTVPSKQKKNANPPSL